MPQWDHLRLVLLSLALYLPLAALCLAEEETQMDLEPYRGQTIIDITLAGNHVTKEWIIAREIWSEVGDEFDPQLARDDLTRLTNLSIFGSVIVEPTASAAGVALNYEFTEMPWIIPYPALKYTEENGFSVGLGIASPNFRHFFCRMDHLFGVSSKLRNLECIL